MSGVYIKGMEMPKNCAECPVNMNICHRGYEYLLEHTELYDRRADDCPLIPVPDHGRLIDADALVMDNGIKEIPEYYEVVCDAPTIIPADCKEERTVKWREWNTFVPASQADKVGGE